MSERRSDMLSADRERALRIWIIIVVVVVLLVGLGGAAALLAPRFMKQTPQGLVVRTEPASRGELVEVVAAPGVVKPVSKVAISARVSARIIELPFDEGAIVTRGSADVPASVLVRLDSSDIEAQLRAGQARYQSQEVEIATAEARLAARELQLRETTVRLESRQSTLARQRQLLATSDVSRQSVDDLQSEVDQLVSRIAAEQAGVEADRVNLGSLRFQLAAAAAEIDRIKESLSYTTIVSPIDGLVTKREAEVGEIALVGTMNNPGTQIMEVADLSKMFVEARVDEADIAQVKVDQNVRVRIQAYPDVIFKGTVTNVALTKTTSSVDRSESYKVEVFLETDGKLVLSGLNADVEIETVTHRDVIRIPSQAVLGRLTDDLPAGIRTSDLVNLNRTITPVVYRIVDGKAMVTPVNVGPSDLTHTLIVAGLDEGAELVTGPYKVLDALRHEQAVQKEKVEEAKPDAESKPQSTASN
jgi:HlyD family secretion protein